MAGRGKVYAFLLIVLCGAGAWAQSDSCGGFKKNIGDGWCDTENNNEECMYDGGDCCRCEVDTTQDDFALQNFFSCRDPASDCVDPLVADYPDCTRGDVGAIGDGFCDLTNNNEGCMYDGGDCCLCPTVDDDGYLYDDSFTISSSFTLCVDPDGACYEEANIAIQVNCTNGYIQGIGDGFCNLENNNAGCQYDGGDCCQCGPVNSPQFGYGYSSNAAFSLCIDPDDACFSGASQLNCTDGLNEGIGNGWCDEENNNAGCLYDGGDCCPCTCVPGMTYECGTNGYSCLSSGVSDREGDVCPDTITSCDGDVEREWAVEDTSGALQLAEALQCAGGLFNVEWSGSVVMSRTLSISNGTILTVVGIDADAAIVGDGTVGLFSVTGATLHLQNITLMNGSASYGGAVSASRSRLIFSEVSFVGNSASDGGGGALYVSDGAVLSFVGTSSFDNNTAPYGGALYAAYGSSAVWGGKTSFSFNGAFAPACYGFDGPYVPISQTTTGSTSTSSCEDDVIASGYGGALYLTNSSSAVWTSTSHFVYNHADIDGGAIFVAQGSSMVWAAESHFLGNRANEDGGAVFMERSSTAWTAAAKFSENIAGYDGGALYVTDGSSADWIALSSFLENTAGSDGGAVFAATNGTLTWGKNALFAGNFATNGGAFFFSNGAKVVWGGETHFASNVAGLDGGAIASRALDSELTTSELGAVSVVNDEGSYLYVQDTLSFTNNSCGANGGAMALVQSLTVTFDSRNITFSNNTARISGGAIFLAGTGIGVVFQNVTFVGNSAQTGGAVYATGSGTAVTVNQFDQQEENPTTFIGCYFAKNFAYATGGAVDSSSGLDLFLHTIFVANEARVGGGLRLAGTASVRQCYFEENISELGGGPAVSSVGFLSNVNFSEFVDNVFDCDPGTFLDFEKIDEESDDRFKAVCDGCESCEDCEPCEGCTFKGKGTPKCTSLTDAGVDHATSDGRTTTLEKLDIDKGYWRATNTSTNVFECFNTKACVGGVTENPDYCLPGYEGPYCCVCMNNYVTTLSFTCRECSDRVVSITVATVMGVMAIAFGFAMVSYLVSADVGGAGRGIVDRVTRRIPMQSVKIVVVAWQILTQFASVANVTFPSVYQRLLDGVDLLNFDLSWIVSTGCFLDINFHDRLLWTTIAPIATMGLLGLTYAIAVRANRGSPETALRNARHKHVSAALLVTFLVYSSASSVVFQMFACDDLDDGKRYLRADYTIECDSRMHRMLQVYASFMIVLYPVGIPALYTGILLKNRKLLQNKEDREKALVVRSTADLWEPYKPQAFFYEVVECARRILLAGVVVFIYPNTAAQIAVTLAIAVVFVFVSEGMAPYESQWDAWISRIGHAVVFASMYLALLLKVDVSGENSSSQTTFEAILVGAHGCMVLAVMFEAVIMAVKVKNEKPEAEDARPALRRSSTSIIGVQPSVYEVDDDCKEELRLAREL